MLKLWLFRVFTLGALIAMIPACVVMLAFFALSLPSVLVWKTLEWIDSEMANDPFSKR